ncbi:hypothetical protein SLEP1_g20899 [Rubroshorea leprosula]|uniref:Uncharacterized protein n=1 Tax=Rubroshorea leprosula TaxID=152421 RepID=A0AAV5JEU9_9ROSI|nr:hypothetical protein SLEP1_g20899 [Rubroshorea leprosula]
MATFRRSKDVAAGRCKPTMGCKKHPKHHQSPGVCSLCLREKLSRLSTSSSRSIPKTRIIASSCSSSSLSSDSSSPSSCSSPVYPYDQDARYLSGKGSLSMIGVGINRLTKSKTTAFFTKPREKEGDERKNRTGFLSKLLHPKRKEEELMHSRTVRVR